MREMGEGDCRRVSINDN